MRLRRALAALLVLGSLTGLTVLTGGWLAGGARDAAQAAAHDRAGGDAATLKAAREYNRRLTFRPAGDGTNDPDYQRQLSRPPDGIMASIDYPRLSIRLSIRHGSSPKTLAGGAGHLYGTALPVGGTGTRTVITAHRGGAGAPMFTRLGEARTGDVFHLTAAGQTIAYRVTDIRVLDPGDTAALAPKAGEDLATLLTCTPYGVNTKRLTVTGRRTRMPGWTTRPADRKPVGAVWLLAAAWTGGIATLIPFEGEDHEIQEHPRPRRRGARRARHTRRAVGAGHGPEGDRRNPGDETPPLRGGHDPQP